MYSTVPYSTIWYAPSFFSLTMRLMYVDSREQHYQASSKWSI